MEIGHRPPPGVAPRPCPAPAAPALLFLSLRAGAELRAGPACGAAYGLRGTGSGVSWTREQGPRNTVRSGRRKSHRVALASARSGSAPDPRAPTPGTHRCLHPHRRPLPAPCSAERSYSSSACLPNTGARLRSALLGSTRLGPQAPLSPLGTACCTPPALCFSSLAASN